MRKWMALTALGALAAATLWSPPSARADGFVAPKGTLWTKIAYRNWFADRTFAGPEDPRVSEVALGDAIPFDPSVGGELELDAVEVQAEYVPLERLVVGVYFPVVQNIRFENETRLTETTGTGDIRPYVGYQITSPDSKASTTLYLRPKIPTTEFEVSEVTVPLSEGQFDLGVEQVTSWRPIPKLQFTGSTMFRYRFAGEFPGSGAEFKPGNEFVVRGIIGGQPVETLWLKGGYNALWSTGLENRETDTPERSDFRSFQQVIGGAYWNWGRFLGGEAEGLALDASITYPFAGRDYPKGITWALGLAWSTRLHE